MCRQCDWFKIDLPEYLFPATSDVDASIIDTDVIREVCEVWYIVQRSHTLVDLPTIVLQCLTLLVGSFDP